MPDAASSAIKVVKQDSNPDTLAVQVGRMVAGAAIEDHFLDVVLPTLVNANRQQRDQILKDAARLISKKLDGNLSDLVMPALKGLVSQAVHEQAGRGKGLSIEIYNPATEKSTYMSRQHFMFPALLRLLCVENRNKQPLNIAVVGPAGNGKSSMALACAEALTIPAVLQPFNPQTTKSDLLGYMAADGKYVPSPFYQAFTEGKLYIADEFDAANPAVAVSLNAAVANRTLTFPNLETARAHPNFRAVFVMNTAGTGADHQYTGRMRQDAATLDRLVYLHVPIDPGLESALADVEKKSPVIDLLEGGKFNSKEEILNMVLAVREAIKLLDMKYIISPRATLHATALHDAGFGRKWIMETCIWKGMPDTDRELIRERAKLKSNV